MTLYRHIRVGIKRRACMALLCLAAATPIRTHAEASDKHVPTFRMEIFQTNTMHSCRGIAAPSRDRVWIGGGAATITSTTDGGLTWKQIVTPAPAECDFRDVAHLGNTRLVIMSSGPGTASRVMVSNDEGASWETTLVNHKPDGFYNGIAFRDAANGVLVGDPIQSRLTVMTTADGGMTWNAIDGPKVDAGEYGFAASGTGVVLQADGSIAIVTGGSRCRCFHLMPDGDAWQSVDIGISSGNASAGAFSIALANHGQAVAIGGDYLAPVKGEGNVAVSSDNGLTWSVPAVAMPHKACVAAIGDSRFLACGRTGIAMSRDAGLTWRSLNDESFYTMSVVAVAADAGDSGSTIWMAGADGRAARIVIDNE
jgi:photosystem II stability/assembly factor-like uncharacterized protein